MCIELQLGGIRDRRHSSKGSCIGNFASEFILVELRIGGLRKQSGFNEVLRVGHKIYLFNVNVALLGISSIVFTLMIT